jgi:hypothetical protein
VNRLAEAGAVLLGGAIREAQVLHCGDLSQIVRVSLADGRKAIVKSAPQARAEAAMLAAIAASGAPAPAVLAVNGKVLVLEVMPAGGALDAAWPAWARWLRRFITRKDRATAGQKTMHSVRLRSQITGRMTGQASGRSIACVCILPVSRPFWRAASKRSRPVCRTGCRRGPHPRSFMATCGAAMCSWQGDKSARSSIPPAITAMPRLTSR